MATYKLIQDIEAEDKILGPLTLRQFVFALITVFLLYINFICITKGAVYLLVLFLPPALLTGFFAFPFGRDQPTEIWALGKLRFWFKPRRRIWDQSGMKELVTITVPKKVQHNYTNGLSQSDVQSRLKALASTIDSRGWVVKDVAVNSYAPSLPVNNSDRLLDISTTQEVPDMAVLASDDILDEQNNPIARQFDDMIGKASTARRQQLVDSLNSTAKPAMASAPAPATAPSAQWFMPTLDIGTPSAKPTAPAVPAAVINKDDEAALTAQLRAKNTNKRTAYGNLRTIRPGGGRSVPVKPAAAASPAIMALARNDDLNVATIAREAQKSNSQNEVVISLH